MAVMVAGNSYSLTCAGPWRRCTTAGNRSRSFRTSLQDRLVADQRPETVQPARGRALSLSFLQIAPVRQILSGLSTPIRKPKREQSARFACAGLSNGLGNRRGILLDQDGGTTCGVLAARCHHFLLLEPCVRSSGHSGGPQPGAFPGPSGARAGLRNGLMCSDGACSPRGSSPSRVRSNSRSCSCPAGMRG